MERSISEGSLGAGEVRIPVSHDGFEFGEIKTPKFPYDLPSGRNQGRNDIWTVFMKLC